MAKKIKTAKKVKKSKPKSKEALKLKQEALALCAKLDGDPSDHGEFIKPDVAKKSHDNWFKRTYGKFPRRPKPSDVKALVFGRNKIEMLFRTYPDWRGIRLYFCDRKVENQMYSDVFIMPIDADGKDMVSFDSTIINEELLNTSALCPDICGKKYMK